VKENSRPMMLMSMRVTEEMSYVEKRSALAYEYIEYFESLGFSPILVPSNTKHVEQYLSLDFHAIVLTGGNTVNTEKGLDGSHASKLAGVYEERDEIERQLIDGALAKDKPLLGICRGMQFINAYYAGTGVNELNGHVGTQHQLISKHTVFSKQTVNSYHNDGLVEDGLSTQLELLACTEDGVVEAFRHANCKILGLQWHPERAPQQFDQNLITTFLNSGKII